MQFVCKWQFDFRSANEIDAFAHAIEHSAAAAVAAASAVSAARGSEQTLTS
jgi:hypothetical protein